MSEPLTLTVFSEKQQESIIGFMLRYRNFYIKSITLLKKEWFVNPILGELFNKCQQFYQEYGRPPTTEELKGKFNLSHTNYRTYHDKINICVISSNDFGIDFITTEMTGWMKTLTFQNCIEEASRIYNNKDWVAALNWTNSALKSVNEASFMEDNTVKFNDGVEFFQKRVQDYVDCLTIGHPDFDELLRPGSKLVNADLSKRTPKAWTNGGLVKGDSTMILGPSNSGKTTTNTSIIVPNLLNGRYVLYITHEQKFEDIKTKIYMNACNLTHKELTSGSPSVLAKINYVEQWLNKYLVYVPWIKSGDMYVESVIAEILIKQEELIAKVGHGFDMLVNDYPGKLRSQNYKGKSEWGEADYVYDQFVNLVMEHRMHGIFPVQTNREGYKVNRGDATDNREVDQADAAGSFGIMQKADNVITLNRSPKEQTYGAMRFHISKSRGAAAQTTFATATKFDASITHSPLLNAMTWDDQTKKDINTYMSFLVKLPEVLDPLVKVNPSDSNAETKAKQEKAKNESMVITPAEVPKPAKVEEKNEKLVISDTKKED